MYILFFKFTFNWSTISLQCVGFCCTAMWISHKCTYTPSLLSPPPLTPSHFSRWPHSKGWASCVLQPRPTSCLLIFYRWSCTMVQCYSFNSTCPLLPALYSQTCSLSVSPFLPWKQVNQCHFSRFHIYINIQYLVFSFWLSLLYITGSRFIHLSSSDPNSLLCEVN